TLEKILNTHPARKEEAYLLNYLGRAYFNMHLYDKALVLLDNALQLSREENLKNIEYRIMNLIGSINGNRGEITKGLFYFEQIIDKEINIYRKFILLTNIILLYSISGNYTRAREYYEQSCELFKTFSGPMLEVYFLRAPVHIKFEIGDYEDAIKHLENMNRAASKINFKSYIYSSYMQIGHSYYYLNKFSKAEQYYDLAVNYIDKKDKYQNTTVKTAKALVLKTKSLSPTIEKTLLEAKKQYDEINFLMHKRHCLFHLADYYLKKQNYDKAAEYLGQSLGLCADKDYISFLEHELIFDKTLFDFAILSPKLASHRGFIRSIFEREINKLNIDWLSDECKRRLSIQTDKLYHINLISFGTFEFRIGGNFIPEKMWIRKKAKLILAFLLVNKREKLTKDKLLDMFFGELPVDTAENAAYQAITNIKDAIKRSIPTQMKLFFEKKKISPYLDYKNKILQLNQDFFYKSDANEFEELYHQIKSSEIPNNDKIKYAKKAIEFYKGEFLSGHDDVWCLELRQKYLNMFIDISEDLISRLMTAHQYEEVIFYADRLIQKDKLNSCAFLNVIVSYKKLGKHKLAKNKYSNMIKVYDEELGESPPKIILEKINNLFAE
ncbi:MAG: tetratricopeptide repeat protein, partial [Ignavibacteria bacterium]